MSSAPVVPSEPAKSPVVAALPVALWPVVILTLVNVLNYLDRFLITALLPNIQKELGLSDTQGGFLGTAFILVYFVVSPLFGWLGDRGTRKGWIALGVGLWSIATGLGGVARGFPSLLAARAAVGIGEAAQGTISPSLLADYVPKEKRGRILSIFYVATPVGSALGYLLGGAIGGAYGWRNALFIVGFPGLLLAIAILFLREPKRGVFDDPSEQVEVPWKNALHTLLANKVYVWTVLGYTAYTFAIGGLAFWAPSYFVRERGFGEAEGPLMCGALTVVAGALGTAIGGFLGDRRQKKSPNGYVDLSIVSMIFAGALSMLALWLPGRTAFLATLGLAQVFMFISTGPVNALIVNTVPASVRATAVALSIFMIHLLGDALSPTLIGMVADRSGLTVGLMLIPVVYWLAGILWLGARVPVRGRVVTT